MIATPFPLWLPWATKPAGAPAPSWPPPALPCKTAQGFWCRGQDHPAKQRPRALDRALPATGRQEAAAWPGPQRLGRLSRCRAAAWACQGRRTAAVRSRAPTSGRGGPRRPRLERRAGAMPQMPLRRTPWLLLQPQLREKEVRAWKSRPPALAGRASSRVSWAPRPRCRLAAAQQCQCPRSGSAPRWGSRRGLGMLRGWSSPASGPRTGLCCPLRLDPRCGASEVPQPAQPRLRRAAKPREDT